MTTNNNTSDNMTTNNRILTTADKIKIASELNEMHTAAWVAAYDETFEEVFTDLADVLGAKDADFAHVELEVCNIADKLDEFRVKCPDEICFINVIEGRLAMILKTLHGEGSTMDSLAKYFQVGVTDEEPQFRV